MYIEIHWKDYKRFGPDGSTHLLAKWLMMKLSEDYGEAIQTICITGCCRSLAMPNKNLTPVFERFEELLSQLREQPKIRFLTKKKELAIDYATVWPTADEFQPDELMIKVGTFRRSFLKLISLMELAHEKVGTKIDFNFHKFITDLKKLEIELPTTLDHLVDLYLECRKINDEERAEADKRASLGAGSLKSFPHQASPAAPGAASP